MGALTLGLAAGGVSLLTSFAGEQSKAAQQRMQADQLATQADATRKQAKLEGARGEAEAYEQDLQKRRIRREFQDLQAANRVRLGAGNVDMTSGSALDVSLGNINRFADDMGENHYQKALRLWQGGETAKNLRYQADAYDANASYLKRTAGNLGASLLTSLISGASSFGSVYTMAGGKWSDIFTWNNNDPASLFAQGSNYTAKGKQSSQLAKDILNYSGII